MAEKDSDKPLVAALRGTAQKQVPFWLMRQAGRYLPEYRALREKAGGFLDLVFNPDFAAEVTMQPVRRFHTDAAILFSDILVVPKALGQEVAFREGEGPVLRPVRDSAALSLLTMRNFDAVLAPILETIKKTRGLLKAEGFEKTALIGFAGAPWTVACYMIEGGSSRDFIHAKSWAYREPETFGKLIDLLTEATVRYLSHQIEAGAEAVQLFDSWAGVLDEPLFRKWVIAPTGVIARRLRKAYPHIPLIGFPRGAGRMYQDYAQSTDVAAIGLDQQVPLKWAATLQAIRPVQGNLDPVCLLASGDALVLAAEQILAALGTGPFVFNLGHGILKETPPENVVLLAQMIRDWRN